ncbi:hypothetical protein DHEL01_v210584 [Diaporthe helianthi]|uniref:Heterokaryon incompatibility domain-containing protein n=1 Tax=Diaporthe helianthi TaxID=158607 RepID=A0A2P5HL96_DIAHE|nr:hypothetical protein DHEL01_v210584 [Diaporthe helianthi]
MENLQQPADARGVGEGSLAARYQYSPLPSARHTRLVTLHPGDFSDSDIVVDLDPIPLTPGCQPPYEAVSYRWDQEQSPLTVHVGKDRLFTIPVTCNLAIALIHLRYPDRPRHLWVDGLCIDQSDDIDKGYQVAQMGIVYCLATRVIAWLGPEGDDSTRAMKRIAWMGRQVDVDHPIWKIRPSSDCTEPAFVDEDAVIPVSAQDTLAIYHLVCREWFGRLWIRQEILACEPRAVVQCGEYQISWPVFRRGLAVLYRRRRPRWEYEGRLYNRLLLLRGFISQPPTIGLGFIRAAFGQSACSDMRDRIYALLNFLTEAEREIIGMPDYGKDFDVLFREVLWRWIDRFKCCNLISQCEPGIDHPPYMPTWTPDWSKKETFYGRYFWRGLASSQIAAVCTLSPDHKVLSLLGIPVQRITHLEPVPDIMRASTVRGIADAHRQLAPEHILDWEYHPTGVSMLEAYARIFIANTVAENSEPWAGTDPSLAEAMEIVRKLYGTEEDLASESRTLGPGDGFFQISRAILGTRQIMGTSDGYRGVAPLLAREGDIICILFGCHTPMVLRQEGVDTFRIVGECYALGLSEGEALLGPLPEGIRRVYTKDPKWGVHSYFENVKTSDRSFLDPRLSPSLVLPDFLSQLQQDPNAKLQVPVETLQRHFSGVRKFDII